MSRWKEECVGRKNEKGRRGRGTGYLYFSDPANGEVLNGNQPYSTRQIGLYDVPNPVKLEIVVTVKVTTHALKVATTLLGIFDAVNNEFVYEFHPYETLRLHQIIGRKTPEFTVS